MYEQWQWSLVLCSLGAEISQHCNLSSSDPDMVLLCIFRSLKLKAATPFRSGDHINSKHMTLAIRTPANCREPQLSVFLAPLPGIDQVPIKAGAFAALPPGWSASMWPLTETVSPAWVHGLMKAGGVDIIPTIKTVKRNSDNLFK